MAVSSILNFGIFSTFDLDDIEGRVIPCFKGFPGWGVHFWSNILDMGSKFRSNQRSKVKFTCITFSISHNSRCMYILRK